MANTTSNTERTSLLGSAPSIRRSPPPAAQLETERLGSLKWLLSREQGHAISPPPPSRGVSGLIRDSSAGGGRLSRAALVRRSASADIDNPDAAESRSRGLFSSASGAAASESRSDGRFPRPRSQGATATRRTFGKNAYRLSIDLEGAPVGSSVWVKGRRSSKLAVSSNPATPEQYLADIKRGAGTPRRMFGDASCDDGDSLDGMSNDGGSADCWRRFLWPYGLAAGAVAVVLTGLATAFLFLSNGTAGFAAGCILAVLALAALVGFGLLGQAFRRLRDEGDGYFREEEEEEDEDVEGLASSSMTI